ncbi:hypothetical protein EE612_036301 [Oryza sativa]|nr:hypothetical protein EE612_036301 [Oryza sativa]
MGCAFSSAGGR